MNLLTHMLQQSFLKIPPNYKCHCRTTIFCEWAPLWWRCICLLSNLYSALYGLSKWISTYNTQSL